MGQPESIRRGVSRHDALSGFHTLFQFIAELPDAFGEAHGIIIEADLVDRAAHRGRRWGRDGGAEAIEPLEHAPTAIHQSDGFLEGRRSNGLSGHFLDLVFEAKDFRLPQFAVARLLHLRDFHDVDRGIIAEDLVGLLLAVAGRFPHHQIAGFDVGAEARQLETDEGFDQGAGISGQDLLGGLFSGFRPGAKPHLNRIYRQHDFLGDKHAEGADDFLSGSFGVLQFLDPEAVHFGEHEVEVFHPAKPPRLAQVNITVEFSQDLKQPGMGRFALRLGNPGRR